MRSHFVSLFFQGDFLKCRGLSVDFVDCYLMRFKINLTFVQFFVVVEILYKRIYMSQVVEACINFSTQMSIVEPVAYKDE